ncbi:hypothetical protein L2E82_33057 [Cichorium intybus]|uniref:Uncharacterized protein n=1 Tax=Cichorium intybus TaxID=13427 RepID=A0ACB9BIR6_CICIN|nr:hypothetical protein L2E82_33057 [Cichorium intybus]
MIPIIFSHTYTQEAGPPKATHQWASTLSSSSLGRRSNSGQQQHFCHCYGIISPGLKQLNPPSSKLKGYKLAIGGGVGNIGKSINFGGGDGGDEGDEGGLFKRRIILPEDLVRSAQLLRYIAINARPTTVRFISRSLPLAFSSGFIGR